MATGILAVFRFTVCEPGDRAGGRWHEREVRMYVQSDHVRGVSAAEQEVAHNQLKAELNAARLPVTRVFLHEVSEDDGMDTVDMDTALDQREVVLAFHGGQAVEQLAQAYAAGTPFSPDAWAARIRRLLFAAGALHYFSLPYAPFWVLAQTPQAAQDRAQRLRGRPLPGLPRLATP